MTEEKQLELERTRDILLATLDYHIELYSKEAKKEGFDPVVHVQQLKLQTEEHYNKGRLTKLKQWLRDMTEMPRETNDLGFVQYIKEKTGYDFNIFEKFHNRINKIIERNKINTENEYRDVLAMVDDLCQTDPVDQNKIDILNTLLSDFDKVIARRNNSTM